MVADRITESGKKSIINLLREAMEIEYGFIINYPRVVDQLVNIETIPQEEVAKKLELLGKESIQHAGWIMQLIENLGGEPQLPITVIPRIADIPSLLLEQLDKEKTAQSLFQQAKQVVKQKQAKGILAKIKTMGAVSPDSVADRSSIIRILERLEIDEGRHIVLLQNVISELNSLIK